MKKLIFILLSCAFLNVSFSQPFPINSTIGTQKSTVLTKGIHAIDSAFWLRTNFPDTGTANLGRIDEVPGAIIRVGDKVYMRSYNAIKWIELGSGGGTPVPGGATPTLQQVLTAGSVLTQDNHITGQNRSLYFDSLYFFRVASNYNPIYGSSSFTVAQSGVFMRHGYGSFMLQNSRMYVNGSNSSLDFAPGHGYYSTIMSNGVKSSYFRMYNDSIYYATDNFVLNIPSKGANKFLKSDAIGNASWADTLNVKYITTENGISGVSGTNTFNLSNDSYNPVFELNLTSAAVGYGTFFNINPGDGLYYDNINNNDNTFQNHLAISSTVGFDLETRIGNDALEMKMNSESFSLAQNHYASARPTVTNIITATLAEGVVIHPEDVFSNKIQIKNGKIVFDYDGDNFNSIYYDPSGATTGGTGFGLIHSSSAIGHVFYNAEDGFVQARIQGTSIYTGITATEYGAYLSAGESHTGESGLYASSNDGTIAAYNQQSDYYNYGGNYNKLRISNSTDSSFLLTKLFIGDIGNSLDGEINLWSGASGKYQSLKAGDGEMLLSVDDGLSNAFIFTQGYFTMNNGVKEVVFNSTGITNHRNYDLPDASGTLAATIKNTSSLNFSSTAAQSSSSLTMTVTNAAVGDAVVLDVVTGGSYLYTAYVSAANTVTVTLHNYSSSAVDPAAQNFTATVIKK